MSMLFTNARVCTIFSTAITGAIMLLGLTGQAEAKKECGAFAVSINGSRVFTTPRQRDVREVIPASALGATPVMTVTGQFVTFTVDLNTFTVTNYKLLGNTRPTSLTRTDTIIFSSKTPDVGDTGLTGNLDIRLDRERDMVIERGGPEFDMKIQAKDCTQGGIFQMEPEPATTETNILGSGFRYCYQAGSDTPRFFTNNSILGYDSPQAANVVNGFAAGAGGGTGITNPGAVVWQVQAGGRIGGVLGEDAEEALALELPAAQAACPHRPTDAGLAAAR